MVLTKIKVGKHLSWELGKHSKLHGQTLLFIAFILLLFIIIEIFIKKKYKVLPSKIQTFIETFNSFIDDNGSL